MIIKIHVANTCHICKWISVDNTIDHNNTIRLYLKIFIDLKEIIKMFVFNLHQKFYLNFYYYTSEYLI